MEHPHQFHKGHSSGENITVWTVILGHSFSMKYFAVIEGVSGLDSLLRHRIMAVADFTTRRCG